MLAIRLPEDVENRLEALSKKTGRTKTYYVRKLIVESIEDMEDTYLAIERLEKKEKIWTHEEIEANIDLAN
jgi:RHH-type transcriptional regulator, rel operon repressor / antitoxin RelB